MKVVSHIEEFFKIFYLVFNPFVFCRFGHEKWTHKNCRHTQEGGEKNRGGKLYNVRRFHFS